MKKLCKVVGAILVLIVLLVIVMLLSMGTIIEQGVRKLGPAVMGVPVNVDDVRFNAFSGDANVKNLVVGNPEGFKTAHAFKLGEFGVSVDVPSVLSDKILIKKIQIDAPEITYELSMKGTNIKKLKEQLSKKEPQQAPAGEPEAEEKQPEGKGKRVEISEVVITGGKINLSATGLGGSSVFVPLPTIRLTDIGKEKEGASLVEVVDEILAAVLTGATGAVKGSGKIVGEGLKQAGGLAAEGAKLGADTALKGGEVAGKVLGESVDAAGDTAAKLGGSLEQGAAAAGESARKLGGKLGKESSKILGGLKGRLKRPGDK
jgi:uncharacterized protein involved in outer membrane biogenesis